MKDKIPHCRKCKRVEGEGGAVLNISSKKVTSKGNVTVSHVCTECNSQKLKDWYHSDPSHKEKIMFNNLKSLAKKFGYKLIKE